MDPGSTKGQLLVALPMLQDPNFDRTVVYMLEHNDEGALGLVLNRPSETELADVLPAWARAVAHPGMVFIGGPVSPEAAFAFGQTIGADEPEWCAPLLGPVGAIDLSHDPHEVMSDLGMLRVFAGYAGWGPQQLEGELDVGAWLVVAAEPADLLCRQPDQLWRDVLRRQGGRTAWLAEFPPELSRN